MEISVTSMQIFDLIDHPYTELTADPKKLGPQSIAGKRSPFERKIIALESIDQSQSMRDSAAREEMSMVFSLRSYTEGGNCPLKKEGTMGKIDLNITGMVINYDQEMILRIQ